MTDGRTERGLRLDAALVVRGLARSRGEAAELVRAGTVRVHGRVATKPSLRVEEFDPIEVERSAPARVGRAAYKLETAFERFGEGAGLPAPFLVRGRRCLDAGASTGGFTQVLLERGASHVTALDVGHGQLVPELAADPRVRDLPGYNVRAADPEELGRFEVIVGDLSFISLQLVVPALVRVLAPEAQLMLLVKPQFEVGRARLGKGGLVHDDRDRMAALVQVATTVRAVGLFPRAMADTAVPGSAGNREYLLWITTDAAHALSDDEAAAARAVTEGSTP